MAAVGVRTARLVYKQGTTACTVRGGAVTYGATVSRFVLFQDRGFGIWIAKISPKNLGDYYSQFVVTTNINPAPLLYAEGLS